MIIIMIMIIVSNPVDTYVAYKNKYNYIIILYYNS